MKRGGDLSAREDPIELSRVEGRLRPDEKEIELLGMLAIEATRRFQGGGIQNGSHDPSSCTLSKTPHLSTHKLMNQSLRLSEEFTDRLERDG